MYTMHYIFNIKNWFVFKKKGKYRYFCDYSCLFLSFNAFLGAHENQTVCLKSMYIQINCYDCGNWTFLTNVIHIYSPTFSLPSCKVTAYSINFSYLINFNSNHKGHSSLLYTAHENRTTFNCLRPN